jgi:hypothetical protein
MFSCSSNFAFVIGAAACPAKAGTGIGISVSREKTSTGVDGIYNSSRSIQKGGKRGAFNGKTKK